MDIPSVNIVCFARVTHSRKIFVQQLGRGLRISDDKDFVFVLDFAADVRRTAAIRNLKLDVSETKDELNEIEILEHYQNDITFTDQRAERLIDEWVKDAADLETTSDEAKLNFPHI